MLSESTNCLQVPYQGKKEFSLVMRWSKIYVGKSKILLLQIASGGLKREIYVLLRLIGAAVGFVDQLKGLRKSIGDVGKARMLFGRLPFEEKPPPFLPNSGRIELCGILYVFLYFVLL